jgi:hypothetical protein
VHGFRPDLAVAPPEQLVSRPAEERRTGLVQKDQREVDDLAVEPHRLADRPALALRVENREHIGDRQRAGAIDRHLDLPLRPDASNGRDYCVPDGPGCDAYALRMPAARLFTRQESPVRLNPAHGAGAPGG